LGTGNIVGFIGSYNIDNSYCVKNADKSNKKENRHHLSTVLKKRTNIVGHAIGLIRGRGKARGRIQAFYIGRDFRSLRVHFLRPCVFCNSGLSDPVFTSKNRVFASFWAVLAVLAGH